MDLRGEREGRDRNERNTQKEVQRDLKAKEKDEAKRKEEASKLRSYDNVMKSENMTTNEVISKAYLMDANVTFYCFADWLRFR